MNRPCCLLRSGLHPALIIVAMLLCNNAQSDNQVTQVPFANAQAGSVGLGAGVRAGRSPYKGIETLSSLENENNTDLVPLYLYEGQYLFSHGTRAGVHLWDKTVTLDAVVQYRFDRLETEASDFYRTVQDRDQTLEGGVALSTDIGSIDVSLSWLSDIQSRHNGYVTDITVRHDWHLNRLTFSPYLSLIYQDQDLIQYYYGVSASEARVDLPKYSPSAALFARLGLNTTYRLIDNWYLFANITWESLDRQITDSPLVDERNLYTAFLGFHYQFGNVFQPHSSTPEASNSKDWSWRLHGGYQAQMVFHKLHRGDVKRSRDVHTYLAGATLGKLLSDGDIIDFWGKFSINRRLENDYQDNFWEYNVYAMAMGTGYSPWSQRELFRYGFGFGFSYAQRIPMVEQIKQQRKGSYTSHFLNYLEAQVDFPLRHFTDAKSVRDCYVGVTLIHRSGIFSTSDILGNVSGGSDILAGHMECKR